MKKHLLLAAALLGMASVSQADNQFYFFPDPTSDTGEDIMGEVYGISENGQYAVIFDYEMKLSYLWNREKPNELTLINREVNGKRVDFEAYSVTNDGMVVGSEKPNNTYQYQPRTWKDGEFRILELPGNALNTNYPVAVTGDGKIIGGYVAVPEAGVATGTRAFPCIWERDDDFVDDSSSETVKDKPAGYKLHLYNDADCGNMQGFFVSSMYSDGTVEGTVLGGMMNLAAGSWVAAILKDGKSKFWHTYKDVVEPFYYKGQYLYDVEEHYLDGVKDGWNGDLMSGMFVGADYAGNFYGRRCITDEPVPENGEGTFSSFAAVYNVNTDTWQYKPVTDAVPAVSMGVDGKILFTAGANVLPDGLDSTPESLRTFMEVDTQGKPLNSVDRTNADGSVFGGAYAVMLESTGEYRYYPYLVTLDTPLSGVQGIYADPQEKVGIIVTDGMISVSGAKNVAVYDLGGKLVSNSANASVAPGIYVVKADKVSRKVLVK